MTERSEEHLVISSMVSRSAELHLLAHGFERTKAALCRLQGELFPAEERKARPELSPELPKLLAGGGFSQSRGRISWADLEDDDD